jgi:hypothetical protein
MKPAKKKAKSQHEKTIDPINDPVAAYEELERLGFPPHPGSDEYANQALQHYLSRSKRTERTREATKMTDKDEWAPGWAPIKPTANLDRIYMEARAGPEPDPVLPPDAAAQRIVTSLLSDLSTDRQGAVMVAIERAMSEWGEAMLDRYDPRYDG